MTDSHHNYTIGGVPIKFPCKAYPTQISMMSKIITGIDRKQNCLLESPTGSGKSLALLCSSLGWQKLEHQKQVIANQEDVNCSSVTDGMKSPDASDIPCSKCHCQSLKEGAIDTIDLTVDEHESQSSITIISGGVTQPAVTTLSSSDTNDGKPSIFVDEPDSGDVFQTAKMKFRTPGGSGNPFGVKKRMGVVFDDDDDNSPSTPVGTTRVQSRVSTTTGGMPCNNPCSCTCHSSPSFKEKKCKEEEEASQNYRLPKIFFGTRTHKQIAQIIRELKKTAYNDTKMAILGSREHLCVHPEVSRSKNKNDGCKELLDDKSGVSCRYYQNVQRIKTHWQLEGQGLAPTWDVEDLVKLGKRIKACPYFASRNLASDADIVFCPYNYLIDPLIRSSMEINLKGQIIILDEAHNIEDSAREAASVTIMQDELQDAIDELDKLINYRWREEHCRVMHTVLANLLRWIKSYSGALAQNDFTRASRTWSGVEMVAAFANMGVSPATFDTLKHHLSALQEDANPQIPVEQMIAITSASLMLIKSLFIVVDYFFRENMVFMKDYKVVLIKTLSQRKWQGNTDNRWLNPRRSDSGQVTYSLNFWCLNPAVAFSDIGGEARTIVLTSGTLSPMASFASELGVKFSVSLEANHVIQDAQVWVGSVATGPSGKSLNASYKNTETFNFQDDLGRLVLDICKTVPYGVLCFFSSYSLMFKLSERWKTTGLWNEVEMTKIVMTEARGGQKKEFDEQLKEFYETIKDFEERDITSATLTGILFLAVCRGKVSEGMDFADNNARAVITVGIPFPSFKDPQVELKRAYNDYYKQERGLLSGSEWYEIQAYRALNQALGRCLRHRNDWGALILVDERFRRNPNKYISGLSKWVRNRVSHFLHSRDGIESLKNFVVGRQIAAAASVSSTQENSPTGSPSQSASRHSTPSTPQVKLNGFVDSPAFSPGSPTGSQLHLERGFTKPSAVMHGFPAISLSQRVKHPSDSHDVTPHVPSQASWTTPKRLSSQETLVNTSFSTPENLVGTPFRSKEQVASSTTLQQATPSAPSPMQQFKGFTTPEVPPSMTEHDLGIAKPPSMAKHAVGSTELPTTSHYFSKTTQKVEESPSQFVSKSSQSAKPLRQSTLGSFMCTSPQNATCVRTPIKFCNKVLEKSETSKEPTLSLAKDVRRDDSWSKTSKDSQTTDEAIKSEGNLDNEILLDRKTEQLSQERKYNNRTPSPLFDDPDDEMEVTERECLTDGGDTRDGQTEEKGLMQKGDGEENDQSDEIKEEEKVLEEEPKDGTRNALKGDLDWEEKSPELQLSSSAPLRRSPRKKSGNLIEMNLEKVSSKEETMDSKAVKSVDNTLNVKTEIEMNVKNNNVETSSGRKSRLSRRGRKDSLEGRCEGSVRQSPRKRHCNEERRTDCGHEKEESVVRKSTRSRRKAPHCEKENQEAGVNIEKSDDTADGSSRVTCLECSSILCSSSGFSVVQMSDVPSTFLSEQLQQVSTSKGKRRGNRKNAIQKPLVALRVIPDNSCNVGFQPLAPKKNDSMRLNAHWSKEDGCCFQPVVCTDCSKKMNGKCPAVGYQINCVLPNSGEANLIPDEVWLSSRHCTTSNPSE